VEPESLLGVEVRFLDRSGTAVSSSLGKVDAAVVEGNGRTGRPHTVHSQPG
jgi:hypothetical protein